MSMAAAEKLFLLHCSCIYNVLSGRTVLGGEWPASLCRETECTSVCCGEFFHLIAEKNHQYPAQPVDYHFGCRVRLQGRGSSVLSDLYKTREVQGRAARMISSMEVLPYEEKLKWLGLFRLEKEALEGVCDKGLQNTKCLKVNRDLFFYYFLQYKNQGSQNKTSR